MTELLTALETLNALWDTASIGKTVADTFWTSKKGSCSNTLGALQKCSLDGYELYCLYRKHCRGELGIPEKKLVLQYWESCLERDQLPGIEDLVAQRIADREEAEILLPLLIEQWMTVPEFSVWFHGVLNTFKLDQISEQLDKLIQKSAQFEALDQFLRDRNIWGVARVINREYVRKEAKACKDVDVQTYFRVDNNFSRMLRVISAGRDIPDQEVCDKTWKLCSSGNPVIIAGNGGFGKTSLMLRIAVRWASSGKTAIWLALGQRDGITTPAIYSFFDRILQTIPEGERVLLCIDNPNAGRQSLNIIRQAWPNDDRIQLLLADRCNNLSGLADESDDYLAGWFDGAKVVLLNGERKHEVHFSLKSYEMFTFHEPPQRRRQILDCCASFYVSGGFISTEIKNRVISQLLRESNSDAVSLVDLIYQMIFLLKEQATNPAGLCLDWHEWEQMLNEITGCSTKNPHLYGIVAAHSMLNAPLPLGLFCRFFGYDEKLMREGLMVHGVHLHEEPVKYSTNSDGLLPKHDMSAELFFQFHSKTVFVNSLVQTIIKEMNVEELEMLLSAMVDKNRMQTPEKIAVLRLDYWLFLMEIFDRAKNQELSNTGRARLCLGFLWASSPFDTEAYKVKLDDYLNTLAPPLDDSLESIKLYTEWGRWEAKYGRPQSAEKHFRAVIDRNPSEIYARMELGRLLSRQRGRKKEAADILREAVAIAPDDIYVRVELGRVLSRQRDSKKEAEKHLRYAMKIDPRNPYPCTELGFMLSRQDGREGEAEVYLLGVIRQHPKDISSRDILAKLYKKKKHYGKAKRLYREICDINPEDELGQKGLASLEDYVEKDYF